jgi:hypothetical protein
MSTPVARKKQKKTSSATTRAPSPIPEVEKDDEDDEDPGTFDEEEATPPPTATEQALAGGEEGETNLVHKAPSTTALMAAARAAYARGTAKTTTPIPRTQSRKNEVRITGIVYEVVHRKITGAGSPPVDILVLPSAVSAATPGSLVSPGTELDPSAAFAIPSRVVSREQGDTHDSSGRHKGDHRFALPHERLMRLGMVRATRFVEKKDPLLVPSQGDHVVMIVTFEVKSSVDAESGPINCNVVNNPGGITILKKCPHPSKGPALVIDFASRSNRFHTIGYDTLVEACGGLGSVVMGDCSESPWEGTVTQTVFEEAFNDIEKRHEDRRQRLPREIRELKSRFNKDDPNLGTTLETYEALAQRIGEGSADSGDRTLSEMLPFVTHGVGTTMPLTLCCTASAAMVSLQTAGANGWSLPPHRMTDFVITGMKRAGNVLAAGVRLEFFPNVPEIQEHVAAGGLNVPDMILPSIGNGGGFADRLPLKTKPDRLAAIFGVQSLAHQDTVVEELMSSIRCVLHTSVTKCDTSNPPGITPDMWIDGCVADVPQALQLLGVPVSLEWIRTHACNGEKFYPGLEHVSRIDPLKAVEPMAYFQKVSAPNLSTKGFVNLTEVCTTFATLTQAADAAAIELRYVLVIPGGGDAMQELRLEIGESLPGVASVVSTVKGEALVADKLLADHSQPDIPSLLKETNAVLFGYLAPEAM